MLLSLCTLVKGDKKKSYLTLPNYIYVLLEHLTPYSILQVTLYHDLLKTIQFTRRDVSLFVICHIFALKLIELNRCITTYLSTFLNILSLFTYGKQLRLI